MSDFQDCMMRYYCLQCHGLIGGGISKDYCIDCTKELLGLPVPFPTKKSLEETIKLQREEAKIAEKYWLYKRARCDICKKIQLEEGRHLAPNFDICVQCYNGFEYFKINKPLE